MPEQTWFTPGPWLSAEGEWVRDPRELLASKPNGLLMGTAPDLYDALSHLVWRFSEDNLALRPFLGEEATEKLLVHLDSALRDAKAALDKASGQ